MIYQKKAQLFAIRKHINQLDDSGLPYILHIMQVVSILKKVTSDDDIISAAWLHDTIEDTQTTLIELVQQFTPRIASLVYEVTHEGTKQSGHYFPRLKTRDAILIKFADRLSNLSRMDAWNDKRKKHYIGKSKFWKSEIAT